MDTKQKALFEVLRNEDYYGVKRVLEDGADATALDEQGRTTIQNSMVNPHWYNVQILDLLIEHGANVNQPDANGKKPLDLALRMPQEVSRSEAVDGELVALPPETYVFPNNHAIGALFMRGAKASDHEESIAAIREALCGQSHNCLKNMSVEDAVLAAKQKGLALDAPDFKQPPTSDNLEDPCLPFCDAIDKIGNISSAFCMNGQDTFIELLSNLDDASWQEASAQFKYSNRDTNLMIKDFYNQVERLLIGASLLRHGDVKEVEAARTRYTDMDVNNLLSNITTKGTLESPMLSQIICEGRRPNQIVELALNFHQRISHINKAYQHRLPELEWKPLFAEAGESLQSRTLTLKGGELDGYSIANLTTGQELIDEGTALNHCVPGYGGHCMGGYSHIFSIRDPEGTPISTIEIAAYDDKRGLKLENPAGQAIFIQQHYGESNKEPPEEAKKVLGALVRDIQKGALTINDTHSLGDAGKNPIWSAATPLEKTLYHLKEDMTPERHQEIFDTLVGKGAPETRFRAGRRTYLTPGEYRNMSVDEFMDKSELNALLEKGCRNFGITFTLPERQSAIDGSWCNRIDGDKQTGQSITR